jgi:DNA-binding NarL/FixJ family response regulator
MLLLPPAETRRLGAALHQAGYKPVVPTKLLDWASQRRHTLLLTDDSDRALAMISAVAATGSDTRAVVLVEDAGSDRYRTLLRRCTAALPAGSDAEDVVLAVRAAHQSLSCVPAAAARALAGPAGEGAPPLDDRELSWLRALADNVTVASLARASGYSQREMYRLLSDLYGRLGVATRTEALLRADRLGLLRPRTPAASPSLRPVPPISPVPPVPAGRPR